MADNSAFYLPSISIAPSLSSPGNLYVLRKSLRDDGYSNLGTYNYFPAGTKKPKLGTFGYSSSARSSILSTAKPEGAVDSMQIKFTTIGTLVAIPYRASADPVTYSMLAFNTNGVLDLANVTGQSSLGDDIKLENSPVIVTLNLGMLTDPNLGSYGIVSDISLVYSTKDLSIQGSMLADFYAVASGLNFTSFKYTTQNGSTPTDWYHDRASSDSKAVTLSTGWEDNWIFDKGSGNNLLAAVVRADNISLEQNMSGDLAASLNGITFDSRRVFEVNTNVLQTAGFLADSSTLATYAASSLKGTGLLDLGTQNGARWTGSLVANISDITLGQTKFQIVGGSVSILDDVFTNSKETKDRSAPDRLTFKLTVGKDATAEFTDPDFPVTGLRSEMKDNTFESVGLNAGSVSLSNMTGSIDASVSNITISAEKAKATSNSAGWTEVNNPDVVGEKAASRNVFVLEGNRATAAAVKADKVTLDESFDGTLTAHVAELDTNYREYTYTIKLLDYTNTDFNPTTTVTDFPALATGYRDLLGKDYDDKEKGIAAYRVKVSEDPDVYRYVDSYEGSYTKAPQNKVEPWDATGNYIDPESGFIYSKTEFDTTGKKVFIDPVTGYYVKVVSTEVQSGDKTEIEYKGYLYSDKNLTSRIYWEVAPDSSDPYRQVFRSEDGKYIISRTLTAGDTVSVVDVEDRPQGTKDTNYTNLSGIEAAAYGIYADTSIKASGNMRGDIFVTADADIVRADAYTVNVTRADYAPEEAEAERELYRVGSSTLYGLYAPTITVDGVLDSTIYVVDNSKSWTDNTEAYARTSAEGIHAKTLTAAALGGTICMFSNFGKPASIPIVIPGMPVSDTTLVNLDNASIAVSVKNFKNGNDGSFDIIGDIYSSHFGIFAGVEETGADKKGFNLRVSGNIIAGKYDDGQSTPLSVFGVEPYYAIVDAYGVFTSEASTESTGGDSNGMTFLRANDYLELAAGSHVEGTVYFGSGDDTLVLDSNARLTGDVGMMLGTLNMVFNLNDYAMQELPVSAAATIEGAIPTFSTMLMTVTLNDVDMAPGTAAKTYDLVHNAADTACGYLQSLRVVNVKYDGISLATVGVEGSDIVAQIGYYDNGGDWHTVKSYEKNEEGEMVVVEGANISELGCEFREKNFSAKVGAMSGINFAGQSANYVRIIDRNLVADDQVIFQTHTNGDTTTGTLSIVVDRLPGQVDEMYCADPFPVKLSDLRERYDRENDTFTVQWDDNSANTSQTTYQLEYYIVTYADASLTGDPTFTSRTIVQNVTNKNPRTEVVISNIESNQKVVWRVRQAVGQGNDVVGDWAYINVFERPQGLLETKDSASGSWTLSWRNAAVGAEYYMLSVTVYDKATGQYRQLYDTYIADERGWTVVDPGTGGKVEQLIAAAELGETESISSWSVKRALGDPAAPVEVSESATYQNLQIAKYQFSAVTGLDAKVGTNKAIILSWDNVKDKDVSFVLRYRIVTNEQKDPEWTVVNIAPLDPDEAATVTCSIPMESYMLSDDHLEWEVFACQINGDETSKSVTSTADTTVTQKSGQYVASTDRVVPSNSRLGYVSFTWDNAGDDTTTYLLEYTAGGKEYQAFIDSENAEYFEDVTTGQNRVTWTVKPTSGVSDISWRVRHYQLDDNGDLLEAGEWMIYEREELTGLAQESVIVTDPSSGLETMTTTLSFVSNNPGSAYRLEYVILTGGVAGNPKAVDFESSNRKNFSYQVEGLDKNGTQTVEWRVTTLEDGVPGEWVYETTVMEKTFETVVFLDNPTNASGAQGDGENAVATLAWDHGNAVKNGIYTYVVEYFQNSKHMTADDVTEFFENNTDENTGAILNYAYTRLEVSNNEVTITGLVDTQYVYWRVRGQDSQGGYSDWTVGDPFHVYLADKYAPSFSQNPVQDQMWSSQDPEHPDRPGDMMDVFLTWNAATDDKAGVKNYTFTYKRTGGSAEQLHEVKYYYSIDNGKSWVAMEYDEENGARIDHIEGVAIYKVKIANLANGDYDWTLTATDYQSRTSDAKNGSWTGDYLTPQFAGDAEDSPAMVSTMAAFLSDVPGTASTSAKDKVASVAPILKWRPASDDWKAEGDGIGSGIANYRLDWKDSAGNEFSVTIDLDDIGFDPSTGFDVWQLTPDVPLDPNDDKRLKNEMYTWSFYAIDHMGNVSVISKDFSSLTGEWLPDLYAPVWDEGYEPVAGQEFKANLLEVTATWDAAADYWFAPESGTDPVAGSGVQYYTITYWREDDVNRKNELTTTVYTDYDPEWSPSFSTYVQNVNWNFEISATDYMGNLSEQVLSGTWSQQEVPPQPVNVEAEVSFDHEKGTQTWDRMQGSLVWSGDDVEGFYCRVSYTLLLDSNTGETGDGNPVDCACVLIGFAGNPEAYDSVATFTQVPQKENEWDVVFKYDAAGKVHHLDYDATTGQYTTTFDLNGGTESGKITFNGGTFTAEYDLRNKSNYEWDLASVDLAPDPNSVSGDPEPVVTPNATGSWEGDAAPPNFTETKSIESNSRFIRRKTLDGTPETVNSGTVTIVYPASDWRIPGDYELEGTGVGTYTLRWGAASGDVLDYSMTINVDDFGEGEKPWFGIEVQPGTDYRYEVYATDYYGSTFLLDSDIWKMHTSEVPQEGRFRKDSLAPRITDDIDSLSSVEFEEQWMKNTLTWTAATDDCTSVKDEAGCGTDFYTFTYSFGSDSKTYTVIGDDFDYFMTDTFSGYTREESASGIVTYTMKKKEDNGNSWELVYTCKNTTSGVPVPVEEGGGKYVLTFTLKNEDYNWSLYATDYVGNSGESSQLRSGSWVKDTAAPVFTAAATNTAGKGTAEGTMFVDVSWKYKKVYEEGEDFWVIDPKVPASGVNDGSGVQSFYFKYREVDAEDWNEIPVKAGTPNQDSRIKITYADGVYTAHGNSLDASKDWEWRIDAVDYVGNSTPEEDPQKYRSGVWTRDKLPPRFLPFPETEDVYVETAAIYSETTSGAYGLSISASWNPAVDDWLTVGDGNGTGVKVYTFEYRAAGTEDWTTVSGIDANTFSVLQEDLPNQDYEWRLTATDHTSPGNTSEPLTGTILVDIYAPEFEAGTISLDPDYDETTKTSDMTFSWPQANDPNKGDERPVSGFWKYDLLYKPVGSSEDAWTVLFTTQDESVLEYEVTVKSPGSTSAGTLELADGKYEWKIEAYDKAGNVVTATAEDPTFFFDTVAPVFQQFPDDKYFNVVDSYTDTGLSLKVEWLEALDAVSGVKNYTFSYREINPAVSEWTVKELDAGTTSITLDTSVNGDYEWKLTAVDNVGNETDALVSSWNKADLAAPVFESGTVTLTNVYDVEAKTNALTFNWSKATDPDTGDGRWVSGFKDYTVEYTQSGAESWTVFGTVTSEDTTTFSVTVPTGVAMADGIYQWRISASDKAGNVSSELGMNPLIIDVTAPVFSSEANSVEYTFDPDTKKYSRFTFNWNVATDATSGFDRYELCYGYNDASTGTVITENVIDVLDPLQTSYTLNNQTFKHDGTYSWWVNAVDRMGNKEKLEGADTFVVDTQPPEGEFTSLDSKPVITATWSEYVQWENPFYVTYYDIDTVSVTFSLANTFTEEDTTYQLRVYGKNSSGEIVRMHTFDTENTTITLNDTAGLGAGYVADMNGNTVYWQVRALDAVGNATAWYDGATFQLVDPDTKREIGDGSRPGTVTGLSASDSIDTGVLTLSWEESEDIFGIDSYAVDIYGADDQVWSYITSAANGNLSLKLTQSELRNGKYSFRVTPTSCTMIEGRPSSTLAFTYDTMAPIFDPESVKVKATPTNVNFSWDAMIDNVEAGHYKVQIVRADTGVMVVNDDNVTATSYSWTGIDSGTYRYSIQAVDAHGNLSDAKATGLVAVAETREFLWSWDPGVAARVLGAGVEKDIWTFKLDGVSPLDSRSAAALVSIRIDCGAADSMSTASLTAAIYNDSGDKVDTVELLPVDGGSSYEGQFLMNGTKSLDSTFRIQLSANDPTQALLYALSVRKTDFTLSNTLDDSFSQVRDSAGYKVELPEGELVNHQIVDNEWLGYSDEVDFRQIMVDGDGLYSFNVTDLTAPVEVTLWQMQPSGNLRALEWGLADDGASSLSLDSCQLLQGETYYLSVEDPLAVNGRETKYNVFVSGTTLAS